MIIPKEQRLGYEYRNYHHYAAIILELGTVGKILVTASILDLSNFKFQEFIMMSPIEFYLPGTYPPGTLGKEEQSKPRGTKRLRPALILLGN